MTVPTLSVCLHCGYPQPGRHASSCEDRQARRDGIGVSDRETPSIHCATGLVDSDVLTLRQALKRILRECERDRSRLNPDQARVSIAQAQLRIHDIATRALADTGPEEAPHAR